MPYIDSIGITGGSLFGGEPDAREIRAGPPIQMGSPGCTWWGPKRKIYITSKIYFVCDGALLEKMHITLKNSGNELYVVGPFQND
jgi:hypothetical protein